MPSANMQYGHQVVGESVFGAKTASIRHAELLPRGLSFPNNVPRGFGGGLSPRSPPQSPPPPQHSRGQWPRVASGENAAGAQPCRAERSHSPPLAAIFTCPVSKGDATRRRHRSPPPLPSRGSSWPNPRLWLPPFSSYAAAATAKAKVSAFPALRRRHVRKPAVRHRVQWAEVGRGGGRRRAGA
ncbi:DNA-directed RNA polymerase III subunit RPC7 isoform X2 [Myotis daubentonii]|uniref:DNA-directed RNA polymerase III subunit RPC7 isoform X2 n=1 Tax=Myotis daubentonii TaxID=98922 RepID=UPI0028734174|nr:DNA-directed RNA polymerase III subunit RPC7 isoform X2 [Myotis daubentonii]